MSFNVFSCPRSSLATHKNAAEAQLEAEKPTAYHSCGIWTRASYINHSWMNNVRRSFIGDMMIVRATKDLEPDTELAFWYQQPDPSDYETFMNTLAKWEFECDCAICRDAMAMSAAIREQRETESG